MMGEKIMNKQVLFETLKQGDLEHMISPYISIDQYTSKINNDNITIAIFCNERAVANDLYSFLEKMYVIEIKDIEISSSMTEDNKYILFVEFERNQQFPEMIVDFVDSINFLINKEISDWEFITFGMDKKDKFNMENIKENVRLVKMDGLKDKENIDQQNKKEVKQESVEYSDGFITRKYLDEGVIDLETFEKIVENAKDFDTKSLDKEILEHNHPGVDVIEIDDCCYILGNEIRKLRML
jgi:hypothetical protein